MQLTWLGWAGVELEADDGTTLVIDPVQDAAAVFAPFGERVADMPLPAVVPARAGRAVAGLLTHLHRDHADAAALTAALRPGAPVYEPPAGGGGPLEELALAQAEHELHDAGLPRHRVDPWTTVTAGPFACTALPASDGTGDPQVAWLVEAGGVRVLHLGDTLYHGAFWRMALRHGPFDVVLVPVDGPVMTFPHRQPASPLPGVMDPRQGAVAAQVLGARLAIPMHDEGYELDGLFEPVAGAAERFLVEAAVLGVDARRLAVGERIAVDVAVDVAG